MSCARVIGTASIHELTGRLDLCYPQNDDVSSNIIQSEPQKELHWGWSLWTLDFVMVIVKLKCTCISASLQPVSRHLPAGEGFDLKLMHTFTHLEVGAPMQGATVCHEMFICLTSLQAVCLESSLAVTDHSLVCSIPGL